MRSSRVFLALATTMLFAGAAMADEPGLSKDMQGKIAGIPKDILATMEKNLPTEAPAKPEKPRKLLVFVASGWYYHDSIPVCALALTKMGEKLKTWDTTVSDDETVFKKETLDKYDGIFMVSTVDDHPKSKDKQARQDFVDYIKSGHGLIGTHAASDCNHDWPEYTEMIGGEFAGHPMFQIGVRNEDPENPINAVFGGKGFAWDDEMYVFRMATKDKPQAYSRDKNHVLLSIDVDKTKQWDQLKNKPPRTDGDYAIAWTKTYGEGRVFYCSMGHNRTDFSNSFLLKHYLAGVQYALGDLKTDSTPSAQLPKDRKMGEAPAWDNKEASLVTK